MYPITPRHAVMAGPTILRTVPPNEALKNQTAHSVAFTTCTVCAELGLLQLDTKRVAGDERLTDHLQHQGDSARHRDQQ